MSLILQTMFSLCVAACHISNQEIPFATKFSESLCGTHSRDHFLDEYQAKAPIPKESPRRKG